MPAAHPRRVVVDSFAALARRPFDDGVNAVCWARDLDGDFDEVARLLGAATTRDEAEDDGDGVVVVTPAVLRRLPLSPAGRRAADVMLDDVARLDALGREPQLNCVTRYPRDTRGLAIAVDVMSFHADSAPVEVDTWLCTYAGKSSEGLDNDDARRLVDDPAVRRSLLQAHGGVGAVDDDEFAAWLREGSFDLHHAPIDGAAPFSFGVRNLWRIAVAWPGSRVPPCLHRAPVTEPGDAPRLLLIC